MTEEKGKVEKKLTKKESDEQRMLFTCTDKCTLLDDDEIGSLVDLLERVAACPNEKSEDEMRKIVIKHTRCSVYNSSDSTAITALGPERVYSFPCVHRNHPEECYVSGDKRCTSTEVTLRKAIVHYENMRRLHSILQEATKAHKLLADIDIATVIDDLQYLSKLVRIDLGKPPGNRSHNGSYSFLNIRFHRHRSVALEFWVTLSNQIC